MSGTVHVEIDGDVATLRIDAPDTGNALSADVLTGFDERLAEIERTSGIRFVVVTGTGRTFCSGADLREQKTRNEQGQSATSPALLPQALARITRCKLPVIARVNGAVRAGGMALLGACDLAVATERATFGFPQVRVGVAPAVAAVNSLPHLRPRDAAWLFLTGESFDAVRALELGVVNRIVGDDDLDSGVAAIVDLLRLAGPSALAATKQVLDELPTLSYADAFVRAKEISLACFASPEALEGMTARAEGRAPSWTVRNDRADT